MCQKFNFTGYQNYEPVEEALIEIYKETLGKKAASYRIAVGEAVCNAARYALKGMKDAEIEIEILITKKEITTIVKSETKPFNALKYRKRLQLLAADPETSVMPWGKYTGVSGMSRGFWLMLQACSRIIVDISGNFVELVAPLSPPELEGESANEQGIQRKINALVPRFFVKSNGVIK